MSMDDPFMNVTEFHESDRWHKNTDPGEWNGYWLSNEDDMAMIPEAGLLDEIVDLKAHVAYLEAEVRRAHREWVTGIDLDGELEMHCEAISCSWSALVPEDAGPLIVQHIADLLAWPR